MQKVLDFFGSKTTHGILIILIFLFMMASLAIQDARIKRLGKEQQETQAMLESFMQITDQNIRSIYPYIPDAVGEEVKVIVDAESKKSYIVKKLQKDGQTK